MLEAAGISDRLYLPHRRFHRDIGIYAGHHFDPQGNPVTEEEWLRRRDEWLPSRADLEYLNSIQSQPVLLRESLALPRANASISATTSTTGMISRAHFGNG